MASLLLVDDEPNILRSLGTFLRQLGHHVRIATDAEGARREADHEPPEVAILDLRLGADDGLELMTELLRSLPACRFIMISGHGDIAQAVQAIRAGAWDFLEKPINAERLDVVIRNALRERHLLAEVRSFRERWKAANLFTGKSPAFAACLDVIEKTAASGLTLLLHGANGSGKEVLARFSHLCGDRADKPLVVVNCAAIPRDLAESQLFGHRKGAFTDARADHPGYFGQADGGTLFLDEISELPLELQAKLLRAIEQGEIQPLGASGPAGVSVRTVVASNRDLAGLVAQGRFRQDLFYRINQVPVDIPSLEQRREDIPELIDFLVRGMGLEAPLLSPAAVAHLCSRSWPGNVRELKNLLQRAAVLCPQRPIDEPEIRLLAGTSRSEEGRDGTADTGRSAAALFSERMPLRVARQRLERRYLETQLAAHGWSVVKTAAALDILPNNLSRRLGELGIEIEKRRPP